MAKMCRSSSSSSSLSHFLFPSDFSGTITDRDIINTPLEPLRPEDVPFVGFVDIAPHFGGEIPPKPNFGGVNRRFQAKWADFSGTITDRDIINTPLEPLRPEDVPFVGFVDIALHFGGEIPQKPNFGGVNRRFQAKWAKY